MKKDSLKQGRGSFHRDLDRIIFSHAFRRLAKKTQVHPLALNDHMHTRLTHSLEVASVGRSLGYLVGQEIESELPDEFAPLMLGESVQAACLAHDIGNPPFGHAGEEAIKNWFIQCDKSILDGLTPEQIDDFKSFEGNAQGFRILTKLEYAREGGMRLTYSTLGAFLKYPWLAADLKKDSKRKKIGVFSSELLSLRDVGAVTGMLSQGETAWCRHPLAYLTEAADDICYGIMDLEDAYEMGTLRYEEVAEILRLFCNDDAKQEVDKITNDAQKIGYLRGNAIHNLIMKAVGIFIENKTAIMNGSFSCGLVDQITLFEDRVKSFSKKRIYQQPRKVEIEIGAYAVLGVLLETFCSAAREQVLFEKVPFKSERILKLMGEGAPGPKDNLYNSYLKVVDFISGMTDDYAIHIANQIGGRAK